MRKVDQMLRCNLLQRRGGRVASKNSKIANHVHVVVISGCVRNLCPALGRVRPELQSATEARDARQRLGPDSCIDERLAFEIPSVDTHMPNHLFDLKRRVGRREPVESLVHGVDRLTILETAKEVAIKKLNSFGKCPDIPQSFVQQADGPSQDLMTFRTSFCQGCGRDSEQGVEPGGLKHDDQRLNLIANDQSRATPSLRSDDGNRKGSVKCV